MLLLMMLIDGMCGFMFSLMMLGLLLLLLLSWMLLQRMLGWKSTTGRVPGHDLDRTATELLGRGNS